MPPGLPHLGQGAAHPLAQRQSLVLLPVSLRFLSPAQCVGGKHELKSVTRGDGLGTNPSCFLVCALEKHVCLCTGTCLYSVLEGKPKGIRVHVI